METLTEKPGILGAQVWCLKEEEKMKIYSAMAYRDLEEVS